MTDDDLSLPPGLAVAWGVIAHGRRGPKPAHSIEEIVQAAVDLADAGGIAALSLPRLAARVGVTTNALYRYISSKDELLVRARDAGWGAPPERLRETAATWREAAAAWTGAVIDRYAALPWLLDVPVRGAPVTPCLRRWLENLLESMAGIGLSQREMLGCALLLDGYAHSTASLAHNLRAASDPPTRSAGGVRVPVATACPTRVPGPGLGAVRRSVRQRGRPHRCPTSASVWTGSWTASRR